MRWVLVADGGPLLAPLRLVVAGNRLMCLALLSVTSAGCMRTVTTAYPLPPLEDTSLLGPANGGSALVSHFDFDPSTRSVQGHVAWTDSCRRVVVEQERAREVTRTTPNRTAGVMAALGAVGAGVASAELFTHLDAFSDHETCSTDSNGDTSCSSPQDGAAVLGAVLAGSALALAGASVATFHAKSSTRSEDQVTSAPSLPRVLESGVACGAGAVDGLGVSLYRADERVAASTTDANGDVAFRVPESISGRLAIVADSVPSSYRVVPLGEVLATVDVSL